ncbi:MAG TPA: TetR family transcriptional regulator C-terminal domain-containing protein [Kofleriaceae bacterium]|nr:TetR family transcriptional regulator C-terminal domain-containing protein [Kofleriaceae bacterium]
MEPATKERLLDAGLAMLLQRGYNHLGIQDILAATGVPKGSFYHHFESKEDFGLQVIDRYMAAVHAGLDQCLGDTRVPPVTRVRAFFEATRDSYRQEGYLGCLLGGLGQELSGVSEVFRKRIETCFQEIASRLAGCLDEAVARGDLAKRTNTKQLANLLVDCWEGAALRSRMLRDSAPLGAMLDFYFRSMAAVPTSKSSRSRPARTTSTRKRV